MAKTRQTGKNFSKNSITNASSLKTSLNLPPSYVGKLTTPTKEVKNGTIVTPNKSPKDKMHVDNLITPMEVEPQQMSKNNHSNPTPETNLSTNNTASRLVKRSTPCVDHFATHVDVSTLEVCKKQKHLKSTMSDQTRPCLCLSIE